MASVATTANKIIDYINDLNNKIDDITLINSAINAHTMVGTDNWVTVVANFKTILAHASAKEKGQALFHTTQRLALLAINETAAQVYAALTSILLDEQDITLVLEEPQPTQSVIHELIVGSQEYPKALELLQTYLKRLANPEQIILQKIAHPTHKSQLIDAIYLAERQKAYQALQLLLLYIKDEATILAFWDSWCKTEQIELITCILKSGLLLEYKNKFLLIAVGYRCVAIAELLLDYGANVNYHKHSYSDLDTSCTLHIALNNDDVKCMELLLARGFTSRDLQSRYVPLYEAAYRGAAFCIQKILSQAIATKEDINDAFLQACRNYRYNKQPINPTLEILLAYGADINYIDQERHNALYYATTRHKSLATVKLLLDKGARVNGQGWTLLMMVCNCKEEDLAFLQSLLPNANVDEVMGGDTAITIAANRGHSKYLQILLANSQNRSLHNEAWVEAARNGYIDCLFVLYDELPVEGDTYNRALVAAAEGRAYNNNEEVGKVDHIACCRLLMPKANLEEYGTEILVNAIDSHNRLEMVKTLLQGGVIIDNKTKRQRDCNPLEHAARELNSDMLRLLLDYRQNWRCLPEELNPIISFMQHKDEYVEQCFSLGISLDQNFTTRYDNCLQILQSIKPTTIIYSTISRQDNPATPDPRR